jgi:hypothetical protein
LIIGIALGVLTVAGTGAFLPLKKRRREEDAPDEMPA